MDYFPTLTGELFHDDDSFVRGLMGPIGCTDADTEYLSPTGWKRIGDYDGGLVAQWHPSGEIQFVTPGYVEWPCQELILFENANSVSMCLSPNHRMPLYNWKGEFCVKTAEQVERKPSRHIVPTTFTPSTALGLSDLEIRLRVMIAADGSYPKAGNQAIICVRKERKKERIRHLLRECGIPFREAQRASRPTETVFTFARPSFPKPLHESANWYQASREELSVLLDEMTYWDGLFNHAEIRFHTTKKEEADVVQFAAHACGHCAHIRTTEYKEDLWGDCFCVSVTRTGSNKRVTAIRGDSLQISRVKPADGRQYCFTVPSSFWLARREGRVFVTGNSGKSVACCMEIIMRAHEQIPDSRGRRRSRWAVVRNCYDDITEILTEERGWVLFKDLLPGERVAQLNGDNLEFVEPSNHYSAPYEGEMISFRNEGVDFCVTPDHKMWVSKSRTRKKVWGNYELKKAEDVFGRVGYRVRRDAVWEGEDTGHSEAYCEWLGFWMAEGSCGVYECKDGYTRNQCVITQIIPEGIEYAKRLFDAAGLPYTVAARQDSGVTLRLSVNPDTLPIIQELSTLGHAVDKRVPAWLKKARPGHIKAFIRGYLEGDGKKTGAEAACTSSRQLADELQELALRAGMVANSATYDETHRVTRHNGHKVQSTVPRHIVTFVKPAKYRPRLRTGGYANKYPGWSRVDYSGMVYCLEVPTHVVYVRRNGKAFWCSQTYGELRSTTIKTWQAWVPDHVMPLAYDAPIRGVWQKRLEDGTTMELEILFLALDRPDHVRKLLSLELTGAWLNEAREIPKQILDGLTGRVNRFPSLAEGGFNWSGIIMDTNPPDTDHWWYRLAEEETPQGWAFFSQPPALTYTPELGWQPNPQAENIEHLTTGYDYYLKAVQGKTMEWCKVYIQGLYGSVMDGKPIFSEYNDDIHSRPILDVYDNLPLIIGVDFGLTPAAVICQRSVRGQLRALSEVVSDGMGIRQFTRDVLRPHLQAKFPGMSITMPCDPAGAQRAQTDERTCFDELVAAGFKPVAARTNSFLPRREAVAGFLTRMTDGEPGFLLSQEGCPVVRRGFLGGYKFRRVQVAGEERYHDVPDKNKFSHPMDALQYAALEAEGGVAKVVNLSRARTINRRVQVAI